MGFIEKYEFDGIQLFPGHSKLTELLAPAACYGLRRGVRS